MTKQELPVSIPEYDAASLGGPAVSDLARAIQTNGAVIVRGLLAQEQQKNLRDALELALAQDDSRFGPSYKFKGMVHALMTRGMPFLDLLGNAAIRSIGKSLLGHGCIVHAYNSSSMPPNATNYSRSIHVDSPRIVPDYITNIGMTIALDPFTPQSGGISILPASFRQVTAPSEEEFRAAAIQPMLNPGDMIVFNARCWHRGGENRTERWRHSVTLNICRAYMRQQFDYPRMLDELGIGDITEDAKQFLGYFVRMPNSLADFQLPADQRPYRPGQE